MDDKILEGTTTVGITCKDGVVFASERRASMGNLVAHKVAEKIFKQKFLFIKWETMTKWV